MKMMRMGNSNISLYENAKHIHSEAPSYEMSQVSFLKYHKPRVLLAHDLIHKILKGEEKASLEAVQEAFMSQDDETFISEGLRISSVYDNEGELSLQEKILWSPILHAVAEGNVKLFKFLAK